MEMISLLRDAKHNKLLALVQLIGLVSLVISVVFYFYLVLNFVFI